MTSPRPRPGDPSRPRPATSAVRPSVRDARNTARMALAAIVIAGVALGLSGVLWLRGGVAASGCQSQAWDAAPEASALPADWSLTGTQYDINQMTASLTGTAAAEDTEQPSIYVTVTCFPDDAAGSVDRAKKAAQDAGQTVTDRQGAGDQGFTAADGSGATFVQFRKGNLVTYLAASSTVGLGDLDAVVGAFAKAQGAGAGGTTPTLPASSEEPGASGDVPSDSGEPSESPVSPTAQAALPTAIGDSTISVTGYAPDELSSDSQFRTFNAALRAKKLDPAKLEFAFGADEAQQLDLQLLAFSLPGVKADQLRPLVLSGFLSADGAGVKQDAIKLGDLDAVRVDYGAGGANSYLVARNDVVIVIETADADLAAQAAAALP